LLDAAADTTSAAVVAPLTFNTYFSLVGDANIDYDDDDALQARHRHHNINSYFSDEEDDQSSPSGGEEVDDQEMTKNSARTKMNLPLTPSSCLRSLTLGSSYAT
jgi:hypothetical protein